MPLIFQFGIHLRNTNSKLNSFLGYVNELRDMHLKVVAFKYCLKKSWPINLNQWRDNSVRKNKSEALQLYAEKMIKQRDNILFPKCKLQIHEVF